MIEVVTLTGRGSQSIYSILGDNGGSEHFIEHSKQ